MSFSLHNGVWGGFLDSNLPCVYEADPQFFGSLDLLITCLDSSRIVADLPAWRKCFDSRARRYEVIAGGIWIARTDVPELFTDQLTFFGFDEVYLLDEIPRASDIPRESFTTDGWNFGDDVPPSFVEEFKKLRAIRYLADGCGLNYACESREVALALEEAINSSDRS